MKLDGEREEKSTKFGLRIKKTGELVKFSSRSNDGTDFCFNTTTELNDYGDQVWLVDDAYIAEYARQVPTEWYNATYETPKHGYEPEELELVQVTTITRTRPLIVRIPTVEEYLEMRYGKGAKYENLPHLNHLLKQIKKGVSIKYNLYELQELMQEGILKP